MARLALSQNECLILHLWQLDRYRDEAEVPMAASQEGISQKLRTQVHSISRNLASLESEGLVYDRLAHIRGAPKRRRAYFLTEKGTQVANSLMEDIGKRPVVFEHLGKTSEITFDEARQRMSGPRAPEFLQLAEFAMDNEVIRLEEFMKQWAPQPARVQHFEMAIGRPKVATFFGRANELKTISDSLSHDYVSVLLVWGIPGIGKSTLASKLFESLSGKHSMLWYVCREWDSDTAIISVISEFLSGAGLTNLPSRAGRSAQTAELFGPLCEDMSQAPLMFFFDDVQKLSGRTSSLLSMIIESARVSRKSKVILVSRTIPIFFSSAAPGSVSIELKGLDRDSAWQMARSLNAPAVSGVVEKSRGNPLLLSLMARGSPREALGDINSFIEREVCAKLSGAEVALLKQLSIFRHPVPPAALSGSDVDLIARLKSSALIYEQEQGVWAHDLLRDFFASRSNPEEKAQMHRIAAAYCSSRNGAEWRLEHLYHLVESQDWDDAIRAAIDSAQELADEFPEEAADTMERIPLQSAKSGQAKELLFIRGQLRASLGRTEPALADFEAILSHTTPESEESQEALVLEAVARLQSEVERWSESLDSHRKALRIHERSRDRHGEAREWMGIGAIYRKKKDFKQAREAYERAMSLYSLEEDRAGQAACLNNLALLDWDEGRLGSSEGRFKESVRLAHTVRDHLGEARGLENLSDLVRAQFRYSESIDLLMDSAESFRKAGELSEFKRLQAERAKALAGQGRLSEAIQLCLMSLESSELRRRPSLFQKAPRYDEGDISLSSALVEIYRVSGEMRKAQKELSRYIEMSSATQNASQMARARMTEAAICEDLGDLDGAASALHQAESILRDAGDLPGQVAVQIRMGTILEKKGDESEAIARYRAAVRNSEISGDRRALAFSMENLGFSLGTSSEEGRSYLGRARLLFRELGLRADADRIESSLRSEQK